MAGVVGVKTWFSRRMQAAGEEAGSEALRAEAWHHVADALTSGAAFGGILIAIWAGPAYAAADDWAALVACGGVGFNGVMVGRRAVGEMMDLAAAPELAVAVRALAMKELTPTNATRIVGKEVIVGGINGILFAALIGLVTWAWFGDTAIGLVIGAAMIVNLLIAGFAGVAIPIALEKFKIDPAIGSAVILTTITDVVGFMAFLGLAAIVLL